MGKKNPVYLVVGLAAVLAVGVFVFMSFSVKPAVEREAAPAEEYNPVIDPSNFVDVVDNEYFTLVPGKKFVYEANTKDGVERNEVYVTNETKDFLGVTTTAVWDRVWLEGDLIEDTTDWFAQDKEGNVWYFGEDSKEMALGRVVSTEGSWEAGIDGAKPGIIMKANPEIGDSYRQEYYAGKAEDMGDVLALGESVTTSYGTFDGCLKTRDWTPLEPGADEHKYYCPDLGFTVLELALEDGERTELTEFERNSEPSLSSIANETEGVKAGITEEEAKQIALNEVPGTVTDVVKEWKFGKLAFVIEVDADNGPETDVIIDIETGEVLGIET